MGHLRILPWYARPKQGRGSVHRKYLVDKKEIDVVASKYCYPRYSINSYDEYLEICNKETSALFWCIWPEIIIVDDLVFDFYFDPLDKQTYQKGLDAFASVPADSNKPVINADEFLNGYSGGVTVNNYYGDGTETKQKKSKDLTSSLLTSLITQQNQSQMASPLNLMMEQMLKKGSGKLDPLMLFNP